MNVSCHLTSKYNLGNPKTYSDCIDLLGKNNFIDADLVKVLSSMIGLRNLLVHEYVTVEIEKLYLLLNYLNDFVRFAVVVKDVI